MNYNLDNSKNVNLYSNLLRKHGQSYKALDWGSRESQISRFKVLLDIGIDSNDKILDNGCGLADFYEWVNPLLPSIKYSGIDITPEMVKSASARYPELNIKIGSLLDQKNNTEIYDYVIASGIFFYRQDDPEGYMQEMIKAMFNRAIKGIAFNSLSSWALDKTDGEFYASPTRILDFCRLLSPSIVLRHDYHPADFTIYIYKTHIKENKV